MTKVLGMASSYTADLKFNQKVVVCYHDLHATVVPVTMSCQVSHYCNLHGSQLGKSDGDFSPLVARVALCSVRRLVSRDKAFRSLLDWYLHVLCATM